MGNDNEISYTCIFVLQTAGDSSTEESLKEKHKQTQDIKSGTA